ncbi:MAG TPA: hypothetical protein VLA56_13280 [Pseudomonadales bacterium]|nr:hypothetical protein [Pseudomonadales bacterium]
MKPAREPAERNDAPPAGTSRQREYWAFYWPLAVTGAVTVVAVQFQNGALARYPDAVTELAVFALAQSVYGLFNAALNFTPQLATHFARTARARRSALRYVLVLSVLSALIVEAIALTPPGAALVATAFGIDGYLLERVLGYLALLAPVLVLNGLRLFHVGLLVQSHMTGRVTLLNAIYLGSIIGLLLAGFAAGVRPTWTLVGAQAGGALLHAIAATRLALHHHRVPEGDEPPPDFARLTAFFLPVATTGVMFAVSRPILYAFVARMPDGVTSIAAMRVGFDFTFLFQQASNQFRHFFVAFGLDDLAGKRRFMGMVTLGITALMLGVALTPLGDLVLRHGLGVRGPVLDHALDVILVMTLLPAIIIVRNYYHGVLMVREQTGGMAVGGVLRVAGIAAIAAVLSAFGLLDHVSAAWTLLAGFAIETATVWRRVLFVRARDPVPA